MDIADQTELPEIPVTDELLVKQFSMDATGMMVLQVLTWMWVGSWDKNPRDARNESIFYAWSGFVTFMPMWLYGFWVFYIVVMFRKRMSNEQTEIRVAVETGNQVHAPEGVPITPEQHQNEFAENTSVHVHYLCIWWGLWPVMIKMTLDDAEHYSWAAALSILLFYSLYLFFKAVKSNNHFGVDQRVIRQNLVRLREIGRASRPVYDRIDTSNKYDNNPFDTLEMQTLHTDTNMNNNNNNINNNNNTNNSSNSGDEEWLSQPNHTGPPLLPLLAK
jgi:hypothetical protein